MFKRIGKLIKGFFSLFIGKLEKNNPEAILEAEKEALREQIAKYNKGLAAHAALAERLMSQVKKQDALANELRAKASANLKAGNQKLAGQYALRLQSVKGELDENRRQLEEAEKTYKELIGARDVSVKAARDKIDSLKRDLSDMKMKKAVAELNEMASGMITEIGGSGDTLDRLHGMIQEERDEAAGRARVARDSMDMTDINMQQDEQDALEQQALADFAAAEGIAVEDESAGPDVGESIIDPGSSDATKSMGPAQTE